MRTSRVHRPFDLRGRLMDVSLPTLHSPDKKEREKKIVFRRFGISSPALPLFSPMDLFKYRSRMGGAPKHRDDSNRPGRTDILRREFRHGGEDKIKTGRD